MPAAVACFPFLREGRVVDFMLEAGEWYGAYADKVAGDHGRVQRACSSTRAGGDARADPRRPLHGRRGQGRTGGAPRGERELHMGDAYAATAQAIPAGPAVRGDGAHPRPAAGARRARARRTTRDRCSPWTSARRARRSASCSSRPSPAGSPTVQSIPLDEGSPAGPRHRRLGRDRGARRRARGTRSSTSPCGRRGTDTDARRPRRRDVPLPREGARACGPRANAPSAPSKGAPTKDAALRRATIGREHGRAGARGARSRCFREVLEEVDRCDRLSSPCRGSARTASRRRSTGAAAGWSASSGPIGAGKSSILDAVAFALYGKTPGVGPRHEVADPPALRPRPRRADVPRSTGRSGGPCARPSARGSRVTSCTTCRTTARCRGRSRP